MSVTSIEWADRVWNPVSGCTKVSQGCCVEDQATADQRIPILLQTPAAVRWVSAEPLLEQVDLGAFLCGKREAGRDLAGTGANHQNAGAEPRVPAYTTERAGVTWVVADAAADAAYAAAYAVASAADDAVASACLAYAARVDTQQRTADLVREVFPVPPTREVVQ